MIRLFAIDPLAEPPVPTGAYKSDAVRTIAIQWWAMSYTAMSCIAWNEL